MKYFLIVFVLTAVNFCLADDLFVKPRLLKMYDAPSRKSNIVAIIPRGEMLNSMRKIQGMYLFVRYKNFEGWVVKHSLSRDLVGQQKRTQIFKTNDDISRKAQKDSSSIVDIGGVRGATNLTLVTFGERPVSLYIPKEEKDFQEQYKQLEKIMNNQVGMTEAKEFIP